MNEDPRPQDTYLAFVLRQVAPKAKRLAIWAARITALIVIVLVVPPAGRWIGQRLTALSTQRHEESRQTPPVVTANQPALSGLTGRQIAEAARPITRPTVSSAAYVPPARPAPRETKPLAPALSAPSPTARMVPVSIPEGTTITVALTNEIATDRNNPGDPFKAVLVDDLVSDGHVIARAQTEVRGRITDLRRGSRSENPTITLELDSLEGTAGHVSLSTVPFVIEGKRQSSVKKILRGVGGAVAGAIVGGKMEGKKGAVLGAGLGTVVAMKGDSLALPAWSVSRFQLSRKVALNLPE